MVFHVLNRGVGRRLPFTKDEDFLAFKRRFGGCHIFPRVKWQSQAVKLLPPGDKKLFRLYSGSISPAKPCTSSGIPKRVTN